MGDDRSSGGVVVDLDHIDAIAEFDAINELGQLFLTFSTLQLRAAAVISMKTIATAVACESHPWALIVRCRTVVKMLSIVAFGVDRLSILPWIGESARSEVGAS